MRALARLRSWVRSVLHRSRLEGEIDDELRFHVDQYVDDLVRTGVPLADARRRAGVEFGGIGASKDNIREALGLRVIDEVTGDLRYAYRQLRRSPAFTTVAVLTLALGIGANTAIFSLMDALLFQWLPVRQPQQLVRLSFGDAQSPGVAEAFSYPLARALADQQDIFVGVGAFSANVFNVGPAGAVEPTSGAWVSGAYYETLGLVPEAGRLLTREDDRPGAAPVAVITDGYWTTRFKRDTAAIGRTILIEGVPVTIVGVSPARFTGAEVGRVAEVTLPLGVLPQLRPDEATLLGAGNHWLRVLARPNGGLTAAQAEARLAVVWPQLVTSAVDRPGIRQSLLASRPELSPGGTGSSVLRNQFQQPLVVLMGAVALLLLIACANVANLLLARSNERPREIAVRLAIGAGRARIIRQLLTESLLLSFIAVAVAVAFAALGSRALLGLLSGEPGAIALELGSNWHVLAFTTLLGVGTAIVFGFAPALRGTAVDLTPALKDGSIRTADSRSRLAPALVVLQVALSLLLLVGAGLFVRTLQNLRRLDLGFQRDGVLLVDVDGRRAGYRGPRLTQFYQDVLQEVEGIPGVSSVSLSRNTPLNGRRWFESVAVDDNPPEGAEATDLNAISPRYFQTMQTPLVAGRDFTLQDDFSAPRVAIVDEAFVRRHFPDGQPLGRQVSGVSATLRGMQVVGVVKNATSRNLREVAPPTVYVPYFQHEPTNAYATLEIGAEGPIDAVATAVREVIRPRMPESPVVMRTLEAQVEGWLAQERLLATIAGGFGATSLVLSAVGLYGVLAYMVTRRTNEIGVRMAIGGDRTSILWLVMSDAVRWLLVGIAVGLPAAWAASRLVASLLFGVAPADPLSIAIAILVLIGSGLLAAFGPALRASRIEPMLALRHE